jgi:hypothetical protein
VAGVSGYNLPDGCTQAAIDRELDGPPGPAEVRLDIFVLDGKPLDVFETLAYLRARAWRKWARRKQACGRNCADPRREGSCVSAGVGRARAAFERSDAGFARAVNDPDKAVELMRLADEHYLDIKPATWVSTSTGGHLLDEQFAGEVAAPSVDLRRKRSAGTRPPFERTA